MPDSESQAAWHLAAGSVLIRAVATGIAEIKVGKEAARQAKERVAEMHIAILKVEVA